MERARMYHVSTNDVHRFSTLLVGTRALCLNMKDPPMSNVKRVANGGTPTDTAGLPIDTGLHCPRCKYNLTGVTTSRCPECGEQFVLADLRKGRFSHLVWYAMAFV